MDNVFSAFYVLSLHIYHKNVTVMSSLRKPKKGSLAEKANDISHICVTLLQLKPSAGELAGIS